MFNLTNIEDPKDTIDMEKKGHYIILEKRSEVFKKYYKYDLVSNTFEKIDIDKHDIEKSTPQDPKKITGWIHNCQLVTNDKKFARMFWWTKANPNIKRYRSTIRYIQCFGDEHTALFEQLDILDITVPYIERIIEMKKNGIRDAYDNGRIHSLHRILTNKKKFKDVKFAEKIIGRQLTTEEIEYFGNFEREEDLKTFLRLWQYANSEAYEHLFIYKKSSWDRDTYANIFKSDDLTNIEWSKKHLRSEIIKTIVDYNLDIDRFVEYLNTLYHIEKVNFDDIFSSYHYRDYLRMSKEIYHGRLSKVTKYPINFMTTFHRTKKQYEVMQQIIDEESFMKHRNQNTYLNHQDNKYSIIVAPHPSDIEEEGDKLHHCVRSYIKPMCEGKTLILLMRDIKNLKEPFVTVEVKNNKLTQAYGAYDKKPTNDALTFLRKWANKNNLQLTWKWD